MTTRGLVHVILAFTLGAIAGYAAAIMVLESQLQARMKYRDELNEVLRAKLNVQTDELNRLKAERDK